MKRFLLWLTLLIVSFTPTVSAQAVSSGQQDFYKARVTKIESSGTRTIAERENPYQKVRVRFLDGPQKGSELSLEHGGQMLITRDQLLRVGDTIVISHIQQAGQEPLFSVHDTYRLGTIGWFLAGFAIFIILLAGRKGIGSLSGMIISLTIIMLFIVPQIMAGQNPLTISILGSLAIMVTTIFLAHGLSQRTVIAVLATALSLTLTGILATLFVKVAGLSGLGSEDAYTLLQGFGERIQFQGLLLGGIIIGALGVLDDTTTTQSITVAELAEANPNYSVQELFRRGMRIGREHITSLVNTLVLAYAGAGIGIFIYIALTLQEKTLPWWVMLNSELLSEEIIRTLSGSIGLVLAVPITTVLAAFFAKHEIKIK